MYFEYNLKQTGTFSLALVLIIIIIIIIDWIYAHFLLYQFKLKQTTQNYFQYNVIK